MGMSQSFPPPGWDPPPPQGGYASPYQPPGYWGPGYGPWSPPAAPDPVGSDRPPVRGSRAGTVVAWAVILASVAVVVMRDSWVPAVAKKAMGEERFAKEDARQTQRQQDPDPGEVRSPQLLLAGRYAVGVSAFTAKGPAATGPATTRATGAGMSAPSTLTSQLIDQLDAAAKTPLERLRVIPVVGELRGREAALDRLERFEREHQVVRLRKDLDLLRALYGRDDLAEADQQYLAERHGWFGRLALTQGASPEDARRQEVLASARRTAGMLLGVIFVGLGALGLGVILLIVAAVRLFTGSLRCAYVRPASWRAGPFGESFALYLNCYIILSLALALLFGGAGPGSIWPSVALILILPTAAAWLRFRGVGSDEALLGLGWHKGRGVVREVFAGILGYVTGLPVVAVGMLVSMWIMKHTGQQAAHPIINQPLERPLEAWGVFVLACIVAPVLEETMFRGALFHHLRGKLGFVFSALISSLIFAAIHPQGWAAVPVLGAIALVLSAIRQWRGSLIGCVVAHSLNNSIVTLILLVGMR